MIRFRQLASVMAAVFLFGGCAQKEDNGLKKKNEELQANLHKAQERENTLKGEVSQLTQRVTRLQNDFKLYSQKPCDFELDPVEYSIQKKPDAGAMSAPPPPGGAMTAMGAATMAAEPSGPPAELSDVNNKIRQARRGIKACYQEAAKKNAALQMASKRVQLKFTVQTSGRVSGIMIIPPVGFGFEGCVRGVIGGWRFSKFKGQPQRFRAWMNLRPQ